MRNEKGQFVKGFRASPKTEFKKGHHWRPKRSFRERDYLLREYVDNQRSADDIAQEHGVTGASVYHWLQRHEIPRRTISEVRRTKHWGLSGEHNGMWGKRGSETPNWKGGCSPDRQSFYETHEWKIAARTVWKRDKGVCQRCQLQYEYGLAFAIHHIVSFKVKDLRDQPDNLLLLCKPCHDWVHSRLNTDKRFIREGVVSNERSSLDLSGGLS